MCVSGIFVVIFLCILTDESILLDLKHLLIEAKQKVPDFLANLQSENEQYLNIGGNCCRACKPPLFHQKIGELALDLDCWACGCGESCPQSNYFRQEGYVFVVVCLFVC